MGCDPRMAAHRFIHSADNFRAFRQTDAIDIIQGKFRIPQRLAAQAIPQYIAGKHGAARSHKGDFQHDCTPSSFMNLLSLF